MSDDDRQRRRLGDATKDRIANLADGWSLPAQGGERKQERPATDPADVVPTVPYDKAEEADLVEDLEPTSREAIEVLKGEAQRRSDSEIQREMRSVRAKPPPPPPPGARHRDDDATTVEPPHAFVPGTPSPARGLAALRETPSLPRRKGVVGDLIYVFTVARGLRRAKRELIDVEDEITNLKADRASRLADLGRAAISDDRFDQTAVRSARDLLTDIEDRRSRHAGAAAAADAELEAIDRARQSQLNKLADEVGEAETEVQRLDAEIAPLERESAAARKRAAQVKETLASIDHKIASNRAAPRTPALEAELATLRADREAVSRDEPTIAAELDALLPRIASLESRRSDAQARIAAARAGEREARMRAEEQVTAVQARRRVENRAAADAKTASERALAELGERLYVERPDDLTVKLGAVDKQDVSIATAQRRAIELRELIGSVDKPALFRGIALWALLWTIMLTVVWILVF